MAKFDKFFNSLNNEITATNGETGYLVTINDLLKNGGRNEFFRTIRKRKNGEIAVSRNVYYELQYDRQNKVYYADCYTDCCSISPDLTKNTIVFIGFYF